MKLGIKLKLVLDSFIRHLKMNVMIIIFMAVTAGIITRAFYVYYSNHYVDLKIRELYGRDLNTLYIVRIHIEPFSDEILDGGVLVKQLAYAKEHLEKREMYREIKAIKGVKGFGLIPDIHEQNGKLIDGEYRVISLNRDILDLHKLTLSSGQVVDAEYLDSLTKEYDEVWLVGPDIEGVEPGRAYTYGDIIYIDDSMEYIENNIDFFKSLDERREGPAEDRTKYSEYKIYVEKLERGNQWFECSDLYGNSYDRVPFELLDNVVVSVLTNKGDSVYCKDGEYVLMLEDEADSYECISKIKEIASKYGCGFTCSSVAANRDAVNRKNRDVIRLYLELLVVVLIVGSLLAISIQVTNIISDRKIYGVLYANGAYKKDVLIMMTFENIIRTMVGGFIGFYITYKYYLIGNATERISYNDIIRYSIPYIILIMVVIMLISCIVPYVVLRRYEPADLIEGRME